MPLKDVLVFLILHVFIKGDGGYLDALHSDTLREYVSRLNVYGRVDNNCRKAWMLPWHSMA